MSPTEKKPEYMGEFEQLVFLAIVRLGDKAYGMTVRREIETRTEKRTSLGAVYTTLDRLEAKGYISSFQVNSHPDERQGNPRRFVKAEAPGLAALNNSRRALDAMINGLELGALGAS
jgi:PadR family transcriptional regulator, regulatory protein PadR